jgi:hypothetical protein
MRISCPRLSSSSSSLSSFCLFFFLWVCVHWVHHVITFKF